MIKKKRKGYTEGKDKEEYYEAGETGQRNRQSQTKAEGCLPSAFRLKHNNCSNYMGKKNYKVCRESPV